LWWSTRRKSEEKDKDEQADARHCTERNPAQTRTDNNAGKQDDELDPDHDATFLVRGKQLL
jgi:hypothetical protein